MPVKDYRSADHTVTIWDEGNHTFTITDGRLSRDQSVGLKQDYDGDRANYARYWTTEVGPDGNVSKVTHEDYFLPEKGGEIFNSVHTDVPVPDQPGRFYNDSYLQVNHANGGLEPIRTYPPPKSIPPPSSCTKMIPRLTGLNQ